LPSNVFVAIEFLNTVPNRIREPVDSSGYIAGGRPIKSLKGKRQQDTSTSPARRGRRRCTTTPTPRPRSARRSGRRRSSTSFTRPPTPRAGQEQGQDTPPFLLPQLLPSSLLSKSDVPCRPRSTPTAGDLSSVVDFHALLAADGDLPAGIGRCDCTGFECPVFCFLDRPGNAELTLPFFTCSSWSLRFTDSTNISNLRKLNVSM
jgi:hypothetical protein